MNKIGIMGGTFDPIHEGHLALARAAYEELKLDTVLFIPAKNPPHKENSGITDEQDRSMMVQLALQDEPAFSYSDIEMKRDGMTYTADTLHLLTKQYPDARLYFIVGADSLLYLDKWRKPEQIFSLAVVVAAVRDNADRKVLEEKKEELLAEFGGEIVLLSLKRIDISSTDIRRDVKEHKKIGTRVPPLVADYIYDKGLYL